MAWAGLIILTIVIFLAIACCIRCCCKDKKKHGDCAPTKKNASKIEMQEAPADERCDTARPMNHYMQTEGPEDDESPSGRNPSSTENAVIPESPNDSEEAKKDAVDEAPEKKEEDKEEE